MDAAARGSRDAYFTVPFLKPATTSSALYNGARAARRRRPRCHRVGAGALALRQAPRTGRRARSRSCWSPTSTARARFARLRKRAVFYDYNDQPVPVRGRPAWARGLLATHAARRSIALFVVSEYYRRAARAWRPTDPSILIGNGVEYEAVRRAARGPRGPRGAAAAADRLRRAALAFPRLRDARGASSRAGAGGTLVLIGPGSPATGARSRRLAAREAWRVLGTRPYERCAGATCRPWMWV